MCVALKPGSPFQIHYLAALNGNPVLVYFDAVALRFQKSSTSECPNELNFNANEWGYMMVAK